MYFIILLFNLLIINNYIKNSFLNIKTYDYYNTSYLILQINNNIDKIWGKNEIILVKKNNILEYYYNNKARIYINFISNEIVLETLLNKDLNNVFINILFKSLFNNSNHFILNNNLLNDNKTFIYKNLLKNNGFPLLNKKKIINYVNYLIKNNLNIRNSNKKIFFIKIKMFNINNNYNYYINIINKYSKKYNINKSLILSIIDVESKFNPYVISNSGAIGLMQIMKDKSALDVIKYKKKNNIINTEYLLNPINNINIGVSYLYILKNKYFLNIKNDKSIRYLIIVSYNGGIKNILNIFSLNFNDSIKIINKIDSYKLYNIILNNHPLKETRDYLIKVNNLYKFYKNIHNK